jgi:heat shock protein HslJ
MHGSPHRIPRGGIATGVRLPLALIAALAGCTAQPITAPPAGDNSRNALDWQGVYVGTLPCADCPGIRTRIELRGDGTFARSMTYLERSVAPLMETGSFEWDRAGARITLTENAGNTQLAQVGENVLFLLDRNGQRIGGERAANYRLDKIMNDARIENHRWRLVELAARAVAPPGDREAPYFTLDGTQARVTGNASCNRFSGMYELTSGNRLRFDPNLVATRMACGELDQEREYFEMLARVESYTLADGVLTLNDASGAPLSQCRTE